MNKIVKTKSARGRFAGFTAHASYQAGRVLFQKQIVGPHDARKTLRGGIAVSKQFNEKVLNLTLDAIRRVARNSPQRPNKKHKLEELLGDEIWAELGDENGKLAGRCVAQGVREGRLPLKLIPKRRNDRSTNYYTIDYAHIEEMPCPE